ncbi:DUF6083 domain-containing protein [Streptomyces sp. NPDC018000]|uniref:DUF6083 domain-containing protein n=1 Tax=Streptomyces sp. NPDC018000 TaxID=3365028 RepID=UPI0037A0CD05
MTWIEPPTCDQCGALVRLYPTNYDRWVSLAMAELSAKDVPARYRWRLVKRPARHSNVVVEFVAIRVRGIDSLLSEMVVPAHRMLCVPDGDEP